MDVPDNITIKALATLLLEKKIITGKELNEMIQCIIYHKQNERNDSLK